MWKGGAYDLTFEVQSNVTIGFNFCKSHRQIQNLKRVGAPGFRGPAPRFVWHIFGQISGLLK